ncbi:transmembrane protein 89 [Hipposideros larvatus]
MLGAEAGVGRRYSFSPRPQACHAILPGLELYPYSHPPLHFLARVHLMKGHGPSWNLLPLGEGLCCLLLGTQVPAGTWADMLYATSFLLLLLPLAMPSPTYAWSRPLWYQVGLDLQPWGCQPNSLEGCRASLGCPGHWMGLGGNRIYPVAGVTLTTTMLLLLSRKMLQWRRSQATKSEHLKVTTGPSGPWKRQTLISDRTLLVGVLHMLDALLVQIEGHLQHLATQQPMQIKGTPTHSG